MSIFKKLLDTEYKELKRFMKIADQIEAKSEEYASLTDKQLQNKTKEFKELLENGKTLEDILVDAFATAREASKRVIGEYPYYVQLLIHVHSILQDFSSNAKLHRLLLIDTIQQPFSGQHQRHDLSNNMKQDHS